MSMKPRIVAFEDIQGWLLDGRRRSKLGTVDEVSFHGAKLTLSYPITKAADREAIQERDTRIETQMGATRFVTRLARQGPLALTSGDMLHAVQAILLGDGDAP